jgi:hypothetical protein
MNQILQDWRFGLLLLIRSLIACLCISMGAGLIAGLPMLLQALRISMPQTFVIVLEVIYAAVCCPLIVSSYARYVGFTPAAAGHPEAGKA